MSVLLARDSELRESIALNRQRLDDCQANRATDDLRRIMAAWAGPGEIDFDYVASIVRYELEEDQDCLRHVDRNPDTANRNSLISETRPGRIAANDRPGIFPK